MRARRTSFPWVLVGASLLGSFAVVSCGDRFTSPPTQAGSGGATTTSTGGGGLGGMGGGGAPASCEPLSTEACYDGPKATDGVG